jgi:hypothetical protein
VQGRPAGLFKQGEGRLRGGVGVQGVGGAQHAPAAGAEDMDVPHGGREVAVAEEILDGPDVEAVLDQVGGKGVALIPCAG